MSTDNKPLSSEEVKQIGEANAALLAGLDGRSDLTADSGRKVLGTVARLVATVQRLEAERERVQNAAKAVGEAVGCGDHSCVFKKPTGMGTNGGCRCSRNSIAMGRLAMLYRAALAPTPEDGGTT